MAATVCNPSITPGKNVILKAMLNNRAIRSSDLIIEQIRGWAVSFILLESMCTSPLELNLFFHAQSLVFGLPCQPGFLLHGSTI